MSSIPPHIKQGSVSGLFKLAFVLLLSCNSVVLEEDINIRAHFSDSEIAYLDSILTFFDHEVDLITPNSTDIQESYKDLFKEVKDSIDAETPYSALSSINEKKLEKLFSIIPDAMKIEICYSGYRYHSRTGDSTQFIDINPYGKYSKFLKSVSAKNDFISDYYSDLELATSITPSMHVNMIYYPENLDMKKESERLIYAIHFISLFDISFQF